MSQITAPAAPGTAAPRPSAPQGGEAPELLYVLRRYPWLILIGALLGTLIGVATYFVCLRFFPSYTVSATFQVLPPPMPMDTTNSPVPVLTAEEITRLIRRQASFVRGDPVLEKVMKAEAFQETQVAKYHEKARLREEIDVSQEPNTDLFRISMSGPNGQEIYKLVTAVADTYYDELRNDKNTEKAQELEDLRRARDKLTESVKTLSRDVENYRQTSDIPAMTNAYQVTVQMLAQLNVELMKADVDASSARAYLENITKQIQNNTLQLPAEIERFVEEDPTLRYLEQTDKALKQERAAAVEKYGLNHASVKALDARIAENAKQTDDTREQLRSDARLLVQEKADSAAKGAQGRADDFRERRKHVETELRDLDRKLVEYKNKQQQLETDQKLLEDLNRRFLLENLKSGLDSTRVRFFARPVVPEASDISFPTFKWLGWMGGLGVAGGLGLSFLLAYMLELTNTRVRTPRDITRTMQLPLLGFVPHSDDDQFVNGDLATSIRTSPGSMIAESYRSIRGRLAAMVDGKPISTLLVASVSPMGGATTVANNMANGMALNGQRVLLVDANFYRPGLRNHYANLPAVGLGDALADAGRLGEAIVPARDVPNLQVLGAGSLSASDASALLGSKAFPALLATLKTRYDVVIFDGAPLNLVADSVFIASKVDGVVAVVRAGAITRGAVARVRDQLRQVRANLLGLVLNAAQTHGSGYFKENYRSFYQYAAPSRALARNER